MKQLTLLTNAQIKHLSPEYLKTVLFSKRSSLNFFGDLASVTVSLKYRAGNSTHLLIKISNQKIRNIDDLLKILNYQLENMDKNLKYDKIYLKFKVANSP